jgi:hypothetical protein
VPPRGEEVIDVTTLPHLNVVTGDDDNDGEDEDEEEDDDDDRASSTSQTLTV